MEPHTETSEIAFVLRRYWPGIAETLAASLLWLRSDFLPAAIEAFKMNGQQPRKTLQNDWTLSIQRQLNTIKRETNPVVRGRRARGNPTPVQNKTVYINRVLQVRKTSTGSASNLSNGDIVTTLGVVTGGSYYVDWIRIWNSALGGFIEATLDLDNLTLNTASTGPNIVVGDQGTGASLAGVYFDIPISLSALQIAGAVTKQFVSTVTNGTTDVVLYQIGVRVAMA